MSCKPGHFANSLYSCTTDKIIKHFVPESGGRPIAAISVLTAFVGTYEPNTAVVHVIRF